MSIGISPNIIPIKEPKDSILREGPSNNLTRIPNIIPIREPKDNIPRVRPTKGLTNLPNIY
jgi:hypothetical protein